MHSTHDQGLMFAKMVDSNIDISQAIKMLESWCVNVTTLTIHKHWKHVGMIFGGPLTLGTTDTSSMQPHLMERCATPYYVELADV